MDKKELCEKIQQIYPDIGQCGINLDAHYDEEKKRWVVHLERDSQTPENPYARPGTPCSCPGDNSVCIQEQWRQHILR